MKKLLALAVAASLLAVVAVPSSAQNPPYKIPPGQYCKGMSKKHIPGQKGTPFSQCVTAMAKAATPPEETAKAACKGMSKVHVKGQKGTPFSQCVVAAAQVKKEVASA